MRFFSSFLPHRVRDFFFENKGSGQCGSSLSTSWIGFLENLSEGFFADFLMAVD